MPYTYTAVHDQPTGATWYAIHREPAPDPMADRIASEDDAALITRALNAMDAVGRDNGPLRMYLALKMLRAWNSGTAGYSPDVVLAVNDWIDGGMKGPVPWPNNPFFAAWAAEHGLSNCGGYVGFRLKVALVAASSSGVPSWACSRYGGYEHDWLACPDCLERYEAQSGDAA